GANKLVFEFLIFPISPKVIENSMATLSTTRSRMIFQTRAIIEIDRANDEITSGLYCINFTECARGGNRTHMALRPQNFKSCVYTSSTTRAYDYFKLTKIFKFESNLRPEGHGE